MIKNHISHTFWCLNDDSGDTGGLWKDVQFGVTNGEGKTTINWDEEKYDTYYYPAIWKTSNSKKFIGLDHQVALGKDGISLNEFYSSYAKSEGSNLDGGKTSDGKPVDADKTTTVTTTKDNKTTTTTSTASTTTLTSTTVSSVSKRNFGDANCDGTIDMGDAVLVMQALANPNKYGLNGTDKNHITDEGLKNADVEGSNGLSNNDAQAIQLYLLGKVRTLPVE
jgi:hypothetical protein